MRISDWSSDVCSSDLPRRGMVEQFGLRHGLAVDIALDMADVEPPDQVELVERFDTLGGRFHLERLGQRDDRGDDRAVARPRLGRAAKDRKSTRLNSSH